MKTKRFFVIRTVTAGSGLNAEIELNATDATDAQIRAAALFAHETGVIAAYAVATKKGSN